MFTLLSYNDSPPKVHAHIPLFLLQTNVTLDSVCFFIERSLIAIIESIFGQLDAQELQNAEVVSKAWYEAVRGSSAKLWKNLLERKAIRL